MLQARLMANARENTILCDDNTRRRSTTEVQLLSKVQSFSMVQCCNICNGRPWATVQIIYNALAPIYVKGKVPKGT